jgi:hypothetical protein
METSELLFEDTRLEVDQQLAVIDYIQWIACICGWPKMILT